LDQTRCANKIFRQNWRGPNDTQVLANDGYVLKEYLVFSYN